MFILFRILFATVQNARTNCYILPDVPKQQLMKNFCLRIYLQNWLRYRCAKFQFCLLRSAIIFISQDYEIPTIGDQDISYVSLQFQRNQPSSCWDTALWRWLVGVICSTRRGLLTHWTCVLTLLHQNRSHGYTRLLSNSPVVSKCSLHL